MQSKNRWNFTKTTKGDIAALTKGKRTKAEEPSRIMRETPRVVLAIPQDFELPCSCCGGAGGGGVVPSLLLSLRSNILRKRFRTMEVHRRRNLQ